MENRLKRRMLLASADILVLTIIKKKPMCRQEISNWFLIKFNVPINGSTLHPILEKLKDGSFVKIKKEGQKKLFCLTPKGNELKKRTLIRTYINTQKEINNLIFTK